MKTYLTYGFGIALAGALLTLAEYFLGFHNDPAKFSAGQWVGGIGGLAITIIGLVLAMKAVRQAAADQSLSYGRAVGTGVLVCLFAGIFGAVFMLIYGMGINPAFHDLVYEAQIAKMEEQGMSSAQIEGAESWIRFFTGPIWMSIAQLIGALIGGTIISLIVAAFMKRKPVVTAPPVAPAI